MRNKDLMDGIQDVNNRLRALGTGSPGVKVLPGGYGRNRGWAKTTLRAPASMENDGAFRWRVTSDRLFIETYQGGLILGPLIAAEGKDAVICTIGRHGRPSFPSYFSSNSIDRVLLRIDGNGDIRYVAGVYTQPLWFSGSVPLA